MARDILAHQMKRLGTRRQRKIILGGCILFVLLAILLYTVSIERGNLNASLAFAALVPIFLTKTLHVIATPKKKIKDAQLPWHWQGRFIAGILYSGISLISLIVVTDIFVANRLPDVVVEVGSGLGFLLIAFAYIRGWSVRRHIAKLAKAEKAAAGKKEKAAADKEAADKKEKETTSTNEINKNAALSNEIDNNATPFDEIDDDSNPFDKIDNNSTPFDKFDDDSNPFEEFDDDSNPFDKIDNNSTPFDKFDDDSNPFEE